MRHAALHGARRHEEAVEAFNTMLLKLEESPNKRIRGEPFPQYHSDQPMLIEMNNRTSSSVRRRQTYDSTHHRPDHPPHATGAHRHHHWSSL